jgi:hypothetical protein
MLGMAKSLPVAILFLFIAAVAFAGALFPGWDVRWASRHGKSEVPMSVAGRVAFGVFAGYAGTLVLFDCRSVLLFMISIPLLVCVGIVALRDWRAFKEAQSRVQPPDAHDSTRS